MAATGNVVLVGRGSDGMVVHQAQCHNAVGPEVSDSAARVGHRSVVTPDWMTKRPTIRLAPTPFRTTTRITFAIPLDGRARVKVCDMAGRRVRTLLDEGKPEGQYEVTWDGRDDAGRKVAGGMYVVSLETAGGTDTRKVVYLGS